MSAQPRLSAVPVGEAADTSGRRPSLESVIAQEKRGGRRRAIVVAAVLLVLAAAIAAAVWWTWPKPVPVEDRYRTQAVGRGELVRSVGATGRVEPRSSVEVGAQVSGRIDEVTVDFDDRVRAGQVLARFDMDNLRAQRKQAQANVRAARAALRKAKVDAEEAKRQHDRTRPLYERGIEARERLEAAESAEAVAGAAVDSAAAQLELARANAHVAETNLQYAEVRAPIDGIVISRNVEPGQTVAAAFQTPILFVIAADLAQMQVSASIDEADIGEIEPGLPAVFTVDAYDDRPFQATVTEVRTAPTIAQNVVTYEAILEVANDDLALKPGMTASVEIRTARLDDALFVPNAGLRFTPPDREAERADHTVWVLRGEETVPVHISPGITDGNVTAIDGTTELEVGDRVIVDLTKAGRAFHADHEPK